MQFTKEEIQAANETKNMIIKGDVSELKSIYMAGEICMWDELQSTPTKEVVKDENKQLFENYPELSKIIETIASVGTSYLNNTSNWSKFLREINNALQSTPLNKDKDREVAIAFMKKLSDNLQIELVGGNWYFKTDEDGDQPLDEETVYRFIEQQK